MTRFEKLLEENKEELFEKIAYSIAVDKNSGKLVVCSNWECDKCLFGQCLSCNDASIKWLGEEVEL